MINRIRDIRNQKGLTLTQVAEACDPPTTAQTIGRLETGMRNLSLTWMNRIAAALSVEPEVLLRSEVTHEPQVTAILSASGIDAPTKSIDALLPTTLSGEGSLRVLVIEVTTGEYRSGDQLWLREKNFDHAKHAVNQDVLAPLPSGRFAFGRLALQDDQSIALMPPGLGRKPVPIKNPAWIAVAEMLVRKL